MLENIPKDFNVVGQRDGNQFPAKNIGLCSDLLLLIYDYEGNPKKFEEKSLEQYLLISYNNQHKSLRKIGNCKIRL